MMMISIFYRICTVCEKAVFLKSGVCVSDGEALLQELKASAQEKSSEFSLNAITWTMYIISLRKLFLVL